MNDLLHASTLFLVFALVLTLYGALIAKTGNRDLLPYRSTHSIRNKEDVRVVGRVVVRVGLVIAVVAALGILVHR